MLLKGQTRQRGSVALHPRGQAKSCRLEHAALYESLREGLGRCLLHAQSAVVPLAGRLAVRFAVAGSVFGFAGFVDVHRGELVVQAHGAIGGARRREEKAEQIHEVLGVGGRVGGVHVEGDLGVAPRKRYDELRRYDVVPPLQFAELLGRQPQRKRVVLAAAPRRLELVHQVVARVALEFVQRRRVAEQSEDVAVVGLRADFLFDMFDCEFALLHAAK
mmetsp:Transcript_21849/g.74060  ORF Transcript_21849/g.74060 Transcript_21849/m.74060 type:complete len:218 (-) Transcript_21849:859-1512(-)